VSEEAKVRDVDDDVCVRIAHLIASCARRKTGTLKEKMSADSKVVTLTHGQVAGTECKVHLFGATVVGWSVVGQENIFVSSLAKTDGSKAIRGGIPICFPAFGPWEHGAQHGFARSSWWTLESGPSSGTATGDVKAVFTLTDSEETRRAWDFKFKLTYTITLKAKALVLDVSLANESDKDMEITFALHTYFSVPEVKEAAVEGLKGLTYVDKTDNGAEKLENGEEVKIVGFTDRVYKKSPDECVLKGLADGRSILLTKVIICLIVAYVSVFLKANIADTVVWNPWQDNAAKMSDFGDKEYPKMICVEAAQASSKAVVKAKGKLEANHTLTVQE